MNRTLGIIKIGLLALALGGFSATVVQGKPEMAKKEKTGCATCHVKAGSKDLNDTGKCYQKKGSLTDCKTSKPAAK